MYHLIAVVLVSSSNRHTVYAIAVFAAVCGVCGYYIITSINY